MSHGTFLQKLSKFSNSTARWNTLKTRQSQSRRRAKAKYRNKLKTTCSYDKGNKTKLVMFIEVVLHPVSPPDRDS